MDFGGLEIPWSVGSQWLRWDPHLHAPGTLLNDQFGDAWDDYIRVIETAQPGPRALGITDYFTLRSYKVVQRRKGEGALRHVPLVFPNVEIRLTIETRRGSGINLHLLVSPDDPEHVTKMEERLSRLRFRFEDDSYPCCDDGLVRLGRAHRQDQSLNDSAALSEGANQFKIEVSKLCELFEADSWLRTNVLVAIAAGQDGLAGLSQDASFCAQREELARLADIVFSANPKDRSYWLGEHPEFHSNKQQPKPCLHGCDAHDLHRVLQPDEDRLCWIRAEPTFDGLRQTLVEPERRVHIGPDPPVTDNPGDVIRRVRIRGAPWLKNDVLGLNDGLVTIIGAKGSGKTALADLVAFAAEADESEPGPASFIAKAGELLNGVQIDLEWDDGSASSANLPRMDATVGEPRVRYLSQQFVERLCSPGGLADPLVEEIERVVFSAVPHEDRLECDSFKELCAVRLEGASAEQRAARDAIGALTKQVADEIARQQSVPSLRAKVQAAERDRKAIEAAIRAMPIKASDEKVKAQQRAAAVLQSLKKAIAVAERRTQSLRDLEAEVKRQVRSAEATVEDFKAKYPSLLSDDDWMLLQPQRADQVLSRLAELIEESRQRAAGLRETGLPEDGEGGVASGRPTRASWLAGTRCPQGRVQQGHRRTRARSCKCKEEGWT